MMVSKGRGKVATPFCSISTYLHSALESLSKLWYTFSKKGGMYYGVS